VNARERLGGTFTVAMAGTYGVLVGLPAVGFALPMPASVTLGLFATACGFCAAYFLARSLGERLTT